MARLILRRVYFEPDARLRILRSCFSPVMVPARWPLIGSPDIVVGIVTTWYLVFVEYGFLAPPGMVRGDYTR